MTNQWTRKDDALIAERCEGAKPIRRNKLPDNAQRWIWPDEHTDFLPEYNLEPAACHRAAEAWRLQKPGRIYVMQSACGEFPPVVELFQVCEGVATASTLHEALWLACQKEGK